MSHMNPAPPNPNRVSKLKKRFLDVLSGSVRLDPRGATLFLEGLCAHDDPARAMCFDLSVQFVNGLGSTVLEHLLRASGVGGDALDNLLFHVVEPPIFWDVFVRTFQQGALNEDAQLVFAKVLSRLLTLQDRNTTPYRDVAAQPPIQESLAASSKHEIREMGHLIKHILSSTSSVTVYDVLNGPGGRHDNDFADFCDIAILPTADEILCRKPPFLRATYDDELETSETPVKVYLDNTFRMLREDMLFDIREEIQAALQKGGKHRGLRVAGVSMVGVYTGTSDRKTRWGIMLQCDSDFWQLKKVKDEEDRVKFLTRDPRGSKILKHQSLICLASGEDIISFGTVNRVEELLASNPPVIVLQLDGDVNIRKTLTSLRMAQKVQLIQIDTAAFAFEPVLSALKTRSDIPLSDEILLWNSESPLQSCRSKVPLSRIANALISNPSHELDRLLDLPKSVSLDKAQAKSLVAGLQQRVSLIQGPPGTGKSFIGALLAKAIHDKTAQTILVVCYTNHALDQFLGDLLEYDIPDQSIVRLGGRSNQSTDHLALHKQPRGRFPYNWQEIKVLKSTASSRESTLRNHFDTLLDTGDRNLLVYLEHEYDEFYDAFYVPLETEDGMTRVGRNGQAIDSRYLLSRWMLGQDAGVLSGEPHVQASARIWGMSRSARQQLLDKWRHELITDKLELISDSGRSYNTLQDKIKQQFASATVATLQQKRIIACTTTGAAIYADALQQVGPEVLLVEEAGEILESHILTALSHNVDQMILIGDHKQLRPKVNNYQLTVEKGEGFDLNRSLFERLVLKGYPHETLSTQHRMRPEISAFVRELTYPELVDASSTYGRPDIRGLQSNIIFVDHNHPEDDDSLISDRADGSTKASKQNTYEVQMVLKIVRYLGQQGYNSENIVVLTPYLGQLHRLRDSLKSDNDPILNDMDSLDLARAGLSLAPPDGKAKKGRIHLATIDNYQGEESDIVVTSLTRSNKSNIIGFMDSPERVNVLLSRARNGLILIGNSRTFLHSKKGGALWRRFFTLLEKGQYVFQGFPVKCQRHPGHVILLKGASDFDDHCPDGGCTEPCGFALECGHICPMKCHPDRSPALHNPHDRSQCKYKMRGMCQAGQHRITWECGLLQPPACSPCAKEAERLKEIARQEREAQKKREEAEAEDRRREAEELMRVERERVAEEQRRLREEREARIREARRLEEEARKRQEEEMREREEERKRLQEEREARIREARRREEEARKRQEKEMREREEERKRLQQESLRRMAQCQAEEWEAERQRQEQERLAAERRGRLVAERRQEDIRAAAVARAIRYDEERKRSEEEARKRQEKEARERAEAEARKRQDDLRRMAQRRVEEREAEIRRQEQERRERLVAERRWEDIRAAAVARAKVSYDEERKRAAKEPEPSRCTIQ
ncbi:hypothetical protein HD554DRAFT_1141974 [Boletus coccyginus]|nr:hypothetical protein HD554DRAFT_1141974 [Boletus coccyginus]